MNVHIFSAAMECPIFHRVNPVTCRMDEQLNIKEIGRVMMAPGFRYELFRSQDLDGFVVNDEFSIIGR